jgi:hypothetical protein
MFSTRRHLQAAIPLDASSLERERVNVGSQARRSVSSFLVRPENQIFDFIWSCQFSRDNTRIGLLLYSNSG